MSRRSNGKELRGVVTKETLISPRTTARVEKYLQRAEVVTRPDYPCLRTAVNTAHNARAISGKTGLSVKREDKVVVGVEGFTKRLDVLCKMRKGFMAGRHRTG